MPCSVALNIRPKIRNKLKQEQMPGEGKNRHSKIWRNDLITIMKIIFNSKC